MENKHIVLLESIEHCLLPKLAKAQDETTDHPEFDIRENEIDTHFPIIIKILGQLDFRIEPDIASIALPQIIILDLELCSDGAWFRQKCKTFSIQLNQTFDLMYGIRLCNLLESNDMFNPQLLFDNCVDELHKKLTCATFKKYPSLIEVYCTLMGNVKDYKVKLNPLSVLPISLLLIEDYYVANKVKGLKSCLIVLECLVSMHHRSVDPWSQRTVRVYRTESPKEPGVFSQGNYYEVIFGSLEKCLVEKDLDVTKLTFACLLQLLPILPPDTKINKTDAIYKRVLDQMYTESNLYRKSNCFNFTKQIIWMLGVHCVKRKLFKSIVCDTLDVCSNEAVAEILLQDTLECLSVWMKYCWCVWKLSSDQKMLSMLFKILFVKSEDDVVVKTVKTLIMTMIQLCTVEEQKQICRNLESFTASHNPSEKFLNNMKVIKNSICV